MEQSKNLVAVDSSHLADILYSGPTQGPKANEAPKVCVSRLLIQFHVPEIYVSTNGGNKVYAGNAVMKAGLSCKCYSKESLHGLYCLLCVSCLAGCITTSRIPLHTKFPNHQHNALNTQELTYYYTHLFYANK